MGARKAGGKRLAWASRMANVRGNDSEKRL
jgi:hypothetical protein